MIPGSSDFAGVPIGGLPTSELNTIANQLKDVGFVTETDMFSKGYATESDIATQLSNMTSPGKYNPPPSWSSITIDKQLLEIKPYKYWDSPFGTLKKPKFVTSSGKTLGSTTPRKPLTDLLNRIRRGTQNPPEIEERLNALENQTFIPLDLDDIKEGVSSLFDMDNSLIKNNTFGLLSTIRRIESNNIINNSYCNTIRDKLTQTIKRTDSIRESLSILSREIEGVRVTKGKGTPIETVRAEIDLRATAITTKTVDKALSDFLTGKVYANTASTWFSNQLSTFNIATTQSLIGFDKIRNIFKSGNSVDPNRLNRASSLIDYGDTIVSNIPKVRDSYNLLFNDTYTYQSQSFKGLKAYLSALPGLLPTGTGTGSIGIKPYLEGLGFPITLSNKLDWSALGSKLAEYPPFKGLSDFFFRVVSRVNEFEGIYATVYNAYKKISDSFGKFYDFLFKQPTDIRYGSGWKVRATYNLPFSSVNEGGPMYIQKDMIDSLVRNEMIMFPEKYPESMSELKQIEKARTEVCKIHQCGLIRYSHTGNLFLVVDAVAKILNDYKKTYIDNDSIVSMDSEGRKGVFSDLMGDIKNTVKVAKDTFVAFLKSIFTDIYGLLVEARDTISKKAGIYDGVGKLVHFVNPDANLPGEPPFTNWDPDFFKGITKFGIGLDGLPNKVPDGWES